MEQYIQAEVLGSANQHLLVRVTRDRFVLQGDLPTGFEQAAVAGAIFGGMGVTFC
ncbi:hypothetical protein [Sorangium sp. So ce131]|uniref:hypothetical protein n=1 Tax=Sorangium sp. So ce131 TaxID=3133282 RepID=UPI003F62AFE0